jgi:hypothetical protein
MAKVIALSPAGWAITGLGRAQLVDGLDVSG